MQVSEPQQLLDKFLDGKMTADEIRRFKQSLHAHKHEEVWQQLIGAVLAEKRYDDSVDINTEELFRELQQRIAQASLEQSTIEKPQPIAHRIHFLKTRWRGSLTRAAAAAILLIGGGSFLWLTQHKSPQVAIRTGALTSHQDIQPGGNRAILTVGDQKIDLASNKTGVTVNNAINYNDGAAINDLALNSTLNTQHLTLTTPRGGQYQAILPDGSKVWLNAASSIQFPSKFEGKERSVIITGEAYIEVAKNAKQPFYAHTNKATIQVLGTSFNVNAYEDEEAEKTTLIEGSVKVSSELSVGSKQEVVLKPGQQAELTHYSPLTIHLANVQAVTAWRSGYFKFTNTPIEAIMRQLARWYNLEVVYEGKVDAAFLATIPRNVPISKVLEVLQQTDAVHFTIEGNKIIVKP